MKNKAFTMAETLLVMTMMGIFALIMVKTLGNNNFDLKTNVAQAYKVMETIQQIAAEVRMSDNCPDGVFQTKVLASTITDKTNPYTYEYSFLNDSKNLANTNDVVNIFAKHMKYEKLVNFCTYSNYCGSSDTSIKGMKLQGDVYIGFKVFGNSALAKCRKTYYVPKQVTKLDEYSGKKYADAVKVEKKEGENGLCWGEFYVDVDGPKGDNTGDNAEGKDVFIWGLGENGLVY